MILYVAVCEDHHTDPVIRPFTTLEAAIGYCRAFENAYENKRYFEVEPAGDWPYNSTWGEGEATHVEVVSLDDASPNW